MCEICRQFPCHPRCPNYTPPKIEHYCSICDEGIQNGEEYIENDSGDYAHWECIDGSYDLAEFLEVRIKEMEGTYE